MKTIVSPQQRKKTKKPGVTKMTTISKWPVGARPREKLLNQGVQALSTSELLTILIGSGTERQSAYVLAGHLLEKVGHDLNFLAKQTPAELCRTTGIGKVKASIIMSALEIGKRRQLQKSAGIAQKINNIEEAKTMLGLLLKDLGHEEFYVLYLNHSHKLVRHESLSRGGLTATIADIRIILKNALLHNSSRIILAHNHPSGNPEPSRSDILLTKKIQQAAEVMDIKLLDHIIISSNGCLSMQEEGYL